MPLSFTVEDVNDLVAAEFPSSYADGFRCTEVGEGFATARWTFDDQRLRPGGYIPGPVIFGLADSALWYATFTLIGLEPMAVTSELSVRFLRPARNGDLMARARVNSVSTRRIAGTIELWVDGTPDKLVALAQGTYVRPSATESKTMNPPAAHDGAGAS